MSETLLGFQLRVDPRDLQAWDSIRRAKYLLTESIERPLSVDTTVWPLSKDESLCSNIFVDYETDPTKAPNGLDVYQLRNQPGNEKHSQEASGLIAITSFGDIAGELKARHAIQDATTSVADLEAAGWGRIGYDVADYWLTSGLTNCGYMPSEKTALSARFGGVLNAHGLFDDADDAARFGMESSNRVPEHAPFVVYGIWSMTGLQRA